MPSTYRKPTQSDTLTLKELVAIVLESTKTQNNTEDFFTFLKNCILHYQEQEREKRNSRLQLLNTARTHHQAIINTTNKKIINAKTEEINAAVFSLINELTNEPQLEHTPLTIGIKFLGTWAINALDQHRRKNINDTKISILLHAIAKPSLEHAWYANQQLPYSRENITYATFADSKITPTQTPNQATTNKAPSLEPTTTQNANAKQFWGNRVNEKLKNNIYYSKQHSLLYKRTTTFLRTQPHLNLHPMRKTKHLLTKTAINLPDFPEIEWNTYLQSEEITALKTAADDASLLKVRNRCIDIYGTAREDCNKKLQWVMLRTIAHIDFAIYKKQLRNKALEYKNAISGLNSNPLEPNQLDAENTTYDQHTPRSSIGENDTHFNIPDDDEDNEISFNRSEKDNDEEDDLESTFSIDTITHLEQQAQKLCMPIIEEDDDDETGLEQASDMLSVRLATSSSTSSIAEPQTHTEFETPNKIRKTMWLQSFNKLSKIGKLRCELTKQQVEFANFYQMFKLMEKTHIPEEKEFWHNIINNNPGNLKNKISTHYTRIASKKLIKNNNRFTLRPQKKYNYDANKQPFILPNESVIEATIGPNKRGLLAADKPFIPHLVVMRDELMCAYQKKPMAVDAPVKLSIIAHIGFLSYQQQLEQDEREYKKATNNLAGKIKAFLPKTTANSCRRNLIATRSNFRNFIVIGEWLEKTKLLSLKEDLDKQKKSSFQKITELIDPSFAYRKKMQEKREKKIQYNQQPHIRLVEHVPGKTQSAAKTVSPTTITQQISQPRM